VFETINPLKVKTCICSKKLYFYILKEIFLYQLQGAVNQASRENGHFHVLKNSLRPNKLVMGLPMDPKFGGSNTGTADVVLNICLRPNSNVV
jgi:hypothetical protein